MPAEVFEDTVDLLIGLLEAELPSSTSDPSYPYARLTPAGREESRTFRAIILENETLRLTVLPELGGRLLSIYDKRTGTQVLPFPSRLHPELGGPRGVTLPWGAELYTQGGERLNSLGPTNFASESAPEEDLPAAVWIEETVGGAGLSFHLRYSLEPDRPEFTIEAKIFNRTYTDLPYNGAIAFHVAGGSATRNGNSQTYFSPDRSAGLWIDFSDSVFDGGGLDRDLILARFPEPRSIAPRQLDSFSIRIVPFSGLPSVDTANREGAATIEGGSIRMQSSTTRLAHKLFVLTVDGQTLEAPVDLYPERILEIPLSDLPSPVRELALMSPSKQEILRVPSEPGANVGPAKPSVPVARSTARREEASFDQLQRMTFEIAGRHVAYALLARHEFAQKEYLRAENHLEQALLYNAEDHLSWWARAMATRVREGPGGERTELLNAHFLAPLEPALRAEAFLAQDQEMGKEPSPLLTPLEQNPEAFVEVAALLADLGLNDQATRWIDEALRHVDLAMLRYLQGFCYLRASRMHVEAAECVAAASRLGYTPPLPWRDIEWEAISALHARFPANELLTRYFELKK